MFNFQDLKKKIETYAPAPYRKEYSPKFNPAPSFKYGLSNMDLDLERQFSSTTNQNQRMNGTSNSFHVSRSTLPINTVK